MMRLNQLRTDTTRSSLWYAAIAGMAALVYVCLIYFQVSLDILVIVSLVGLCTILISGLPSYSILFAAVFISIFLNIANYTFFSYSAEGARVAQGEEARLLVLMRLPVVMFGVLVVLARYGSKYLTFVKDNWDLTLLSVVPFAGVLFAPDTLQAVQYSVWFFFSLHSVLALVFLLGLHVPSGRWGEHIAWLMLGGYLSVVILAGLRLQAYTGGGILTGAYADSNIHAIACPVVIASLLILWQQRGKESASKLLRKMPFLVLLGLGALTLVTLLFAAKRTPIVAVGGLMVIYVFGSSFSSSGSAAKSLFRTLALVIPLLAITWVVLPQAETTLFRFEKAGDTVRDQSMMERFAIWETSMLAAKEYPVFGVGLDNGRIITEMYAPTSDIAGYGLHNTYIAVLVELGAIGALFFLIVIARSCLHFFRQFTPSFKQTILLVACTPLLLALVEYNLTPGQFLFWPFWVALVLPRIWMTRKLQGDAQ